MATWYYIAAIVCLAFLWGDLRVYLLIICSSVVGTVLYICYLTLTTTINPTKHSKSNGRRFKFLNKSQWIRECREVTQLKLLDSPVIAESFLISETINDFINLILGEFVDGWFQNVSKSRNLFQDRIQAELGFVSNNLKERLSKLDFAKLLVTRIVPVVHEHFNNSVKAEASIRTANKGMVVPMSSIEYDIAVANKYQGGLKGRVTINGDVTPPSSQHLKPSTSDFIGSNDIPTSSSNTEEKKYLRDKINSILPLLLSSNENQDVIVVSLIREILSCTILTSVFLMLREGDFYNVLIVKLIGDNLKHRTQVKQLRKALAEHTKDKSIELPSHYLFKFLETTDYMEFKRMYEAISEINSIELLKQLDSHFISILSTASAGTKYEKRLKLLIGTIKQKLTQLNSSVKNSKDIQLGTILGNSLASISLDEFLKERNKLVMIAFWRDVERIKDPLEDATYVGDDGPSDDDALFEEGLSIGYSNSEDMIKIHKKYFYNLILSIKRNSIEIMEDYIACTNTHKNSNDPERIRLYRRARRELMRIQNEIFQRIHDEDLQDFKRSEYFLKLIEKDVFRDTLSYSSAPVTKNFTTQSMTSIPNKSKSDLFEKNISEEKTTDQRSTIVVKAVEDAFSEIMKYSNASYKDGDEDFGGGLHRTPSYKAVPTTSISTPSKPSISSSIGSLDLLDKSASTNTLTISLKRDLFGDPDPASLFGNDNDNCSGNTAVTGGARSRGKLFDDDDDDNGMDSDIDSFNYETSPLTNSMELDSSVVFGEGSEISTAAGGDSEEENEVYLAAPGNLRLTEEITKLEQEIEKLTEQLTILTPLLKKAELTNNVGELKILRKSKLSLDREISYKELQKQQYIVQENDNSLYGKSRVSIQSYITGSDSGKEVTLYIVEVQKLSNDNPDVVTAGWIVARRFSQFYKLNEYLKARYPFINTISFPKRAVLVLKFQQRQIVEMRKIALSEYLQEIIAIPQVCSDRAFRSFLSSENFNIRKDQLFEESLNKESMTSLSRSGVEMLANKLYGQTKLLLMPLMEAKIISNNNKSDSDMDKKLLENLAEMQNELKQYDGSGGVKTSFVKPICDILVSVFKLNTSKTWLRGRALLAILQQIFGTTIERKVYEMVEQQLKNEETVLDLLTLFQEIVFPNGKFKDPPVIRTLYQRSISKQEAKVLFGIFFQETCSKLFGLSNTMYASTSIFDMLQNDYLNEHLLFEILEVLIDELFRDHER